MSERKRILKSVYKRWLCNELIKLNYTMISAVPNPDNPRYLIYIFDITDCKEEFNKDLARLGEESRKYSRYKEEDGKVTLKDEYLEKYAKEKCKKAGVR